MRFLKGGKGCKDDEEKLTAGCIAIVDNDDTGYTVSGALQSGIPNCVEGYALECQDQPNEGSNEVNGHGRVEKVGVALFNFYDA